MNDGNPTQLNFNIPKIKKKASKGEFNHISYQNNVLHCSSPNPPTQTTTSV